MGIAKKTDGRYVVGMGVTDANDYKGSASYRDIYIQLTADGATEESVEYLTFLKDYAVYHNGLGEPIMPPSVNVWISNNGVTTAVEADDLALDGDNFTICGIKWNGSSWDYSDAGKGGGGGGLPEVTAEDNGDVLTVVEGEWAKAEVSDKAPFIVHFTESGGNWSADKTFAEILTNFDEHGVPKNIVMFAVYDDYMPAYTNGLRQVVTGSTFFLNAGDNTITIESASVAQNYVYVEEHDYTLTPSE